MYNPGSGAFKEDLLRNEQSPRATSELLGRKAAAPDKSSTARAAFILTWKACDARGKTPVLWPPWRRPADSFKTCGSRPEKLTQDLCLAFHIAFEERRAASPPDVVKLVLGAITP